MKDVSEMSDGEWILNLSPWKTGRWVRRQRKQAGMKHRRQHPKFWVWAQPFPCPTWSHVLTLHTSASSLWSTGTALIIVLPVCDPKERLGRILLDYLALWEAGVCCCKPISRLVIFMLLCLLTHIALHSPAPNPPNAP